MHYIHSDHFSVFNKNVYSLHYATSYFLNVFLKTGNDFSKCMLSLSSLYYSKVYRKMLKPIKYLWTKITNIIVLFILIFSFVLIFLTFLWTILYFRSPTLLLPPSYAAWVYRETSIFICMREFYITEGENQQCAFSICHIVDELRAFN